MTVSPGHTIELYIFAWVKTAVQCKLFLIIVYIVESNFSTLGKLGIWESSIVFVNDCMYLLVTLLNYYRPHIPDDVSTYIIRKLWFADSASWTGRSGHVLRDWRSAVHVIILDEMQDIVGASLRELCLHVIMLHALALAACSRSDRRERWWYCIVARV